MIGEAFNINPYLYLLIPVAFLLGSIPFGLIFTRNKGIDIREEGSKNIGATNVLRSAGKMPAVLTLLADLLKGATPVLITAIIVANMTEGHQIEQFVIISRDLWTGMVGLAAVLGHMFSVFLKLKGGKGVATGFGVLLVYSPVCASIILFVWIAVVYITKYVSVGGIVAVCVLPLVYLLHERTIVQILFGVILALLITLKHSSNIKHLIDGTESKVGESGKDRKRGSWEDRKQQAVRQNAGARHALMRDIRKQDRVKKYE